MATGRKQRYGRRVEIELQFFEPRPSAEFGHDVLAEANVQFALVGKVAMWALLPEKYHTYTKDVDFAIRRTAVRPLSAALARRGIRPVPLSIGGLGVRHEGIRVDFIDRREGGLHTLYEEAIADARRRGVVARFGRRRVPVVSAEYLVAMKVVAGSDKDESDAVLLLEVLRGIDLDRAREILRKHAGPTATYRLDALARRAGRRDARPEHRNSG